MRDIHRSTTTWLARRTGRGSTARPPHRSHRRRLTLEPLEGRALLSLTTWTVNSLGDTGTGSGTSGDLRYAITQADQTPGDNTINFAVTGTVALNSALPDLSNTTGLTDIEGPGAASLTVARSSDPGTPAFRIFTIDAGVNVKLDGFTITGGHVDDDGGGIWNQGDLTITGCTISGNSGGDLNFNVRQSGGGIFNRGTLVITGSTISGNGADGGGGIFNKGDAKVVSCTIVGNASTYGGGIRNDFESGTLTVISSVIQGNTAQFTGGGIINSDGGAVTVDSCTIEGNTARGFEGGGIANGIFNGGTMTVDSCTIAGNSADRGGGITNWGSLRVDASTIAANSALNGPRDDGGGIFNSGTLDLAEGSTVRDNTAIDGGGIKNDGGGTLTIADSTISGNSARDGGGIYSTSVLTITGSMISGNSASNVVDATGGGGIYSTGVLTITDSVISGNSTQNAADGGGIFNTGALTVDSCTLNSNYAYGGGGIANYGGGDARVVSSTFAGNTSYYGGGIRNQATLTVDFCTIKNNTANYTGGGIINNSGGAATVNSCTIVDNIASGFEGGGIASGAFGGGTLTVDSSTIAGNSAYKGGGIYNRGPLTISNSTIANNSSSSFGGGITNDGGPLTAVNDTIAYNTLSSDYGGGAGVDAYSGTATLYNSIVARNASAGMADDISLYGGGEVSSASASNLIGVGGSSGLVNGVNGNQVGVPDPGLGPLASYGGPTQTIALLTGSSAIDAGSNALAVDPSTGQPLTTDQRGAGFPRIANGTVDIGAYEVQSYITAVAVGWGTQTAALQTAADGLRLLPAGRNTDLPWLGIDQVQLTLTQAAPLATGDISVIGSSGTNYGPVTVTGSGTSYTITLAQPINAADRVTITIGNDLIAPFTRRLDVLPGDVNDDGVVNVQDMVAIRNQMLGLVGAVPTIFGDINGDGKVDINDYTAVRELIGTTLPSIT